MKIYKLVKIVHAVDWHDRDYDIVFGYAHKIESANQWVKKMQEAQKDTDKGFESFDYQIENLEFID